jgi:hypothetical protein
MIFVLSSYDKTNLMKTKIIPFFLLILFLFSCEDTTYREYTGNSPVYLSYDELRSSVKETTDNDLKNPGKIYFKDNYIFIIEELKGIHVYDNSNPSSPVKKAFVTLPGVVDMVITGNTLYADSYVDIVAVDVQDVNSIHEVGRLKDILPYSVPPVTNKLPMGQIDKSKGIVVDWEVKTVKERVYDNPVTYPIYFDKMGATFELSSSRSYNSSGVSSGGVGIGGSMARFGIKDNSLYLVNKNNLVVIDISNRQNPVKVNEVYPGSGIETMFIAGNRMFLGTTTGMLIFDVSQTKSPSRLSTYNHFRSCDPVIVDDTLAYVTLRSGTNCGGTVNALDVVNIKNILSPVIVTSYPMTNPHGLGKSGDLLFICDGINGLKVYDAANPRTISSHLIYSYPGIKAFDVIPVGNILVLIGDDGLYQYSYSDVHNITLLSTISTAGK